MIRHGDWPFLGRVGVCTQGEYEGQLILLVSEHRKMRGSRRGEKDRELAWYAYVVQYNSSLDRQQGDSVDDFEIAEEAIDRLLDEWGVRWFSEAEDDRVERQFFGMREGWRARIARSRRWRWLQQQ